MSKTLSRPLQHFESYKHWFTPVLFGFPFLFTPPWCFLQLCVVSAFTLTCIERAKCRYMEINTFSSSPLPDSPAILKRLQSDVWPFLATTPPSKHYLLLLLNGEVAHTFLHTSAFVNLFITLLLINPCGLLNNSHSHAPFSPQIIPKHFFSLLILYVLNIRAHRVPPSVSSLSLFSISRLFIPDHWL